MYMAGSISTERAVLSRPHHDATVRYLAPPSFLLLIKMMLCCELNTLLSPASHDVLLNSPEPNIRSDCPVSKHSNTHRPFQPIPPSSLDLLSPIKTDGGGLFYILPGSKKDGGVKTFFKCLAQGHINMD